MHSCRLASLVIAFGLAPSTVIGCNDDRGNDDEHADADTSSESAESTTTSGGDMSCIPGELGCECNGGLCLADFVCVEDVCTEPSDTSEADSESSSSTESGCTPSELDCGGNCIDHSRITRIVADVEMPATWRASTVHVSMASAHQR